MEEEMIDIRSPTGDDIRPDSPSMSSLPIGLGEPDWQESSGSVDVPFQSADNSSDISSDVGTGTEPDAHCVANVNPFTQLNDFTALGTIRVVVGDGQQLLPDSKWVMRGALEEDAIFPSSLVCLMLDKGWIFTNLIGNQTYPVRAYLQIYAVAEDVARRFHRGMIADFRRLMKQIMPYIDPSPSIWNDQYDPKSRSRTYFQQDAEEESLFYIFNTLESPKPSLDRVSGYPYQAVKDILNGSIQGLQSDLYPYQRRSAAIMVQRETFPMRSLDPRKREHHGPTGQSFYFDKEDGILLRYPHLYEEAKGGVLAETMGYGKTLICLAVILATRGHFPSIPDDRLENEPEPRRRTASLLRMAATEACRSAVPWKAEFDAMSRLGYHYERCTDELKKHVKKYSEPIFTPSTPSRKGKRHSDKTVNLCSATLIVVPPNLLAQWQHEISKHTEQGALDVLVIDHSAKAIPDYTKLVNYDIILITKARFEQEYRDNDLHMGKRGKGEEVFQSPLTDMRWLRVICDEGHGFAGSGSGSRTNAMAMLDKMYIERRWVVSGTPANSLLGVEVGLAANETASAVSSADSSPARALQTRRTPDSSDQEAKDLEKLRLIVVNFLKIQPWANSHGSDHASWRRYLGQHRKAADLRTLLQSLIVRHRFEDIFADLCLPPLYNRVAYIEPSFYDKLSINIFISVLASNAVTSERTDEDYMFHAKNRKQLDLLINNVRQSSFHWVGFKPADILEAMRISRQYLDKIDDHISTSDRALLIEATNIGGKAVEDLGWQAFSSLHEIGVYVEDFPGHASEAWALEGQASQPLLLGTVQARVAQQYVDSRLGEDDPTEGLTGSGLRAMQSARKRAAEEDETNAKARVTSNVVEEPKLKDQTTSIRVRSNSLSESPPKKRVRPESDGIKAFLDSNIARARVVGFSSAKLTYLMDRVLELQSAEKIIIFYDANNVAFWIAEALELLSVKFLIYANTLTVARRATYLATFNQKDEFKVLLMDLKQAAHGLHVASASRVFIVTPIWQPSIESQAIKRAHRIGQTRPVYVETLVLKDTLEDRMLKRRKQMSNVELQKAEKSLLDDGTMNQIIKAERFISFKPNENSPTGRVSRLRRPQMLFGRTFDSQVRDNPEEGLVMTTGDVPPQHLKRSLVSRSLQKKRKVSIVGAEDGQGSIGASTTGALRDHHHESSVGSSESASHRLLRRAQLLLPRVA